MTHEAAETWKPSAIHPDAYEVSDLGRLRRTKAATGTTVGLILKPSPSPDGYFRYVVSSLAARTTVRAHRLVWMTFCGPIPDGLQINHLNGIKTDNRLSNLELATVSQNALHSIHVLGNTPLKPPRMLGEANFKAVLKADQIETIFALRRSGLSQQKIADRFGVTQTTISRVLLGRSWAHHESATPET